MGPELLTATCPIALPVVSFQLARESLLVRKWGVGQPTYLHPPR
jgi:hypothetical protein